MDAIQRQLWEADPPAAGSGPGNVWVFATGKQDPMQLPTAVADSLPPDRDDVELIQLAPSLSAGWRYGRVQLLAASSHREALARLPELRQRAEQVSTIYLGTWTTDLVFGHDETSASRDATVFCAANDLLAGVVGVLQTGRHQPSVENFAHNLERFVRPCLASSAPIIMCVVEKPTRLHPEARLAVPAIVRIPGRDPETLPTVPDLAAYIAQSST